MLQHAGNLITIPIAAIPEILGKGSETDMKYLEKCRVKRNAAEYDTANEASEAEALELVEFAKEFQFTVRQWLKGVRRSAQ